MWEWGTVIFFIGVMCLTPRSNCVILHLCTSQNFFRTRIKTLCHFCNSKYWKSEGWTTQLNRNKRTGDNTGANLENDTSSQSPENSDACCRLLQLHNFCISLSLSRHTYFFFLARPLTSLNRYWLLSILWLTVPLLIAHRSHSTQEMWQCLWGKWHLCAGHECPGESPSQSLLSSFWDPRALRWALHPHLPYPLLW